MFLKKCKKNWLLRIYKMGSLIKVDDWSTKNRSEFAPFKLWELCCKTYEEKCFCADASIIHSESDLLSSLLHCLQKLCLTKG